MLAMAIFSAVKTNSEIALYFSIPKKMNSRIVLIKYGGNAMLNKDLQEKVVQNVKRVREEGYQVVLVHGGGPFIKSILEEVKIESEFIEGHRKTTPEALKYIEMALKGEVNGQLVNLLNKSGLKAVGLSGKDGNMVIAKKKQMEITENGRLITKDLGQVGEVIRVNTELLQLLLERGYLPVVTCLASDEEGNDYNVNADLFAGHLAGALKAEHLLMLTNVDGLMRDIKQPESLIDRLIVQDLQELYGTVIKGGMIPKLQSCELALELGVKSTRIVNGTKPENIYRSIQSNHSIGTEICLQ